MAIKHVFSNAVADATGTVTIWYGATTATVAASDLVKPSHWNSNHNNFSTVGGNTSGGSTASGEDIRLHAGNHLTLQATNNTDISIFGPAPLTLFQNQIGQEWLVGHQGNASLHVQPFTVPWNVQHDRIAADFQISNASNSTGSISQSLWFGLYSRTASSLSLISSTSSSWAHTFHGTVSSHSLNNGWRKLTIPWTNTIYAGQAWMGIIHRTSTAGANATQSQLLVTYANTAYSGIFGAASNATDQNLLGLGVYTASTTAMPGSIAFSQINGSGSLPQRLPIWQVQSGTVP
jgi:hypothetical protein